MSNKKGNFKVDDKMSSLKQNLEKLCQDIDMVEKSISPEAASNRYNNDGYYKN